MSIDTSVGRVKGVRSVSESRLTLVSNCLARAQTATPQCARSALAAGRAARVARSPTGPARVARGTYWECAPVGCVVTFST